MRTRSLPFTCVALVLGIGACASSSDAPSRGMSALDAMTGEDGAPASSNDAGGIGPDGSETGSGGANADTGGAGTVNHAPTIRVAAGAATPYTDPSGNVWSADTGFTGGFAAESSNQLVQGTSTPALYDGQRYGGGAGFSYAFALPAGAYDATLKFAENYVTGAGQRVFDVAIGGKTVLAGFDIFAQSGGMWRALDQTVHVTMAAAGNLTIDFVPGSAQSPKVDAIAIVPAAAGDGGAGSDGGGDAAAGIGPSSISTFVTADFTDMTSPGGVPNVVVAPQLFGVSTGGLANGTFSALSDATTRSLIRALNVPLLRLNANYASPQTSASIAPLVAHALDILPGDSTLVIGVDSAASATDLASTMKASSPIACNLWEVHNESQPGQSSSSYDSDALAIAAAVKAVDPSYRIAGDVSAGLDIGDLTALVGATDASTLGLLDFHDYLYCAGGGSAPSDAEVCLAHRPGQTSSTAYADDQLAVQSAVAGTFAASLPVLLGEYNVECSASFSDLRAGTSTGAAFMVSATLSMAAVSKQPVWSAVWDLFNDGGASYNLIDASNNLYPQYYTLQRLIATMPGAMVSTVMGSTGGGLQAWATRSGSHFGLAIVNSNPTAMTGPVALSHWPVDASGTGSATLWTYPQGGSMTTQLVNTPGTLSSVAVSAGSTAPISVPAQSVVILSYP